MTVNVNPDYFQNEISLRLGQETAHFGKKICKFMYNFLREAAHRQ